MPAYFAGINTSCCVQFETTLDCLTNILPFQAEPELIEDIVMQSSHIPFEGPGEKLFKVGDAPLGFYWILAGEVEIVVPEKALITLKPGDMAGLDSFLSKERHVFNVITGSEQVKTLFINRACFDRFRERQEFRRLINKQVLYHLSSYKGLLYDAQKLLLKY